MKHYNLRLLVYIPFFLLSLLVGWILPVFAIGKTRLPKYLSWFMTPDNDFPGTTCWKQVCWLYRNAAYGFAWGPMSYTPTSKTQYLTTGNTNIKARDNAVAGEYLIVSSDGAWEHTRIIQWWNLPVCWKFRTGWILGDAEPGKKCLYLWSFRPMGFRKG